MDSFCGGWNFSKLVSMDPTFIREMRELRQAETIITSNFTFSAKSIMIFLTQNLYSSLTVIFNKKVVKKKENRSNHCLSLSQNSNLIQMSKSVFIEKSDPSFQISVNAVTSTLALVELYSAPLGRYKSEVRDSYKIES